VESPWVVPLKKGSIGGGFLHKSNSRRITMAKLNANTLKVVAVTVKANPKKFTKRTLAATLAEKLGGAGVVLAAVASLKEMGKLATNRVARKGMKGYYVLVPVKA
jgi:hypothetical protein